ncbi:group II intron reverse transcriptase/maturase [Streptomyces sp. NPDC002845]
MNTDELEDAAYVAERRVLKIQSKLHRWAADPLRRFDDLYNLVCDPAFLLTGWMRVRSNKGARTAGVDGETAHYVEDVRGLDSFLAELRADLKVRTFQPLPVRRRGIPKAGGKVRYLGINTIRDRVVQASLKLVLEPIFEADFLPCSYGFRPRRRAHDAIAESRHLASHSYEWVVEGDIEGCFDNIGHAPVLERMRARIGDRRVMALVKAFLKAGILTEESGLKESRAGAPQGGILSPVIANIALSVLDEAIAAGPGGPNTTPGRRAHRRAMGKPNYRICRYADDFLVLVAGTREDAQRIRHWVASVLSPMGLRLSLEKTKITHIDEGLDFLGWRLQRHRKKGTIDRCYVYTYPSKKALGSVKDKVRDLCRMDINLPLEVLLHRLNRVLKGWTAYFRFGISHATFHYLRAFVWQRVIGWLRRKYRRSNWKELRRRNCDGRWWPTTDEVTLFDPAKVRTIRYSYRGTKIPSPWPSTA